jgi:hypothetical protein
MNDLTEVYDVTFTKIEGQDKVNVMHNDLSKAFEKPDGWVTPVITLDVETTEQARALYVEMIAAEAIKVVDDNFDE